jgi:hypothetical protein
MQDEELRLLERLADQGDREAFWKLVTELTRLGMFARISELHDGRSEVLLHELEVTQDLIRRGLVSLEQAGRSGPIERWVLKTKLAVPLLVSIPYEGGPSVQVTATITSMQRDEDSDLYPIWQILLFLPGDNVKVYGHEYRWPVLARLLSGYRGEAEFLITRGPVVAQQRNVGASESEASFMGVGRSRWRDFFLVLHDGAFNGSDVTELADHLCQEYADCLNGLGNDVLLATPEQIHTALAALVPEPIAEYASDLARVLRTPTIRVWLGELLVILRNRLGQLGCTYCDFLYYADNHAGLIEHWARVHHVASDGSPIP